MEKLAPRAMMAKDSFRLKSYAKSAPPNLFSFSPPLCDAHTVMDYKVGPRLRETGCLAVA